MKNIIESIAVLIALLIGLATCQQDSRRRPDEIVLKYKSNATFDCYNLRPAEFYQNKNGTERKYEGTEKNVQIQENKLTLFDIRGEEINANYVCRQKDNDARKMEFNKKIAPYLYKPDKQSQTVSEGNKVEFKCTLLFGYENRNDKIEWEWRKNDTVLVNTTDRILIVSTENDTVLTLPKVVDADKGEYVCHVKNRYGEHYERVNLRVKDALAALWPFLAIVAEVLILCVVLFVYEKKCSKKNTGEDENEQTQNLMGREGTADVKKRSVKA